MAPHSSTLGHNWVTSLSLFTFMHWRRKWQPIPVFLPGESQGQRNLVGCSLWGLTESDTTESTYQYQQPVTIFSSVQSLSRVRLFEIPWTATCQTSMSITNSWSLLKLMSIKLVMPSNHFILCHPFLLLLSIFPSIRVFSSESVLWIRWPKYWSFSFSFSISPSNEYSDWFHL